MLDEDGNSKANAITNEILNVKINKLLNKITELHNDINGLVYRIELAKKKEEPSQLSTIIYTLIIGLIAINSLVSIIHYI